MLCTPPSPLSNLGKGKRRAMKMEGKLFLKETLFLPRIPIAVKEQTRKLVGDSEKSSEMSSSVQVQTKMAWWCCGILYRQEKALLKPVEANSSLSEEAEAQGVF